MLIIIIIILEGNNNKNNKLFTPFQSVIVGWLGGGGDSFRLFPFFVHRAKDPISFVSFCIKFSLCRNVQACDADRLASPFRRNVKDSNFNVLLMMVSH